MTLTQNASEVLKVDTVGRVRTPKEKREEIVAAYLGSGMTGQQFAVYCGVKYSTLMSWTKKSRTNKPAPEISRRSDVTWVEAMVEDVCCGPAEGLSVEIGGSVRMRVGNSKQAALAVEVLRGLGIVRPC